MSVPSTRATTCWVSASRLPDRAALLGRPHHLGSGAASERPLEFRQIRQGPDDPIFRNRVRIRRQHLTLRLEANRVAAELTVGNEEPLLGAPAGSPCRDRMPRQRLPEGEEGQMDAGQISNRFAEHERAPVVDARLDEVPLVLLGDAPSTPLELLAIGLGPPGSGAT